MSSINQRREAFYDKVLSDLGMRYPQLKTNKVSLIKVLHAFEDKIPLVLALKKHRLLAGLVLKRSSLDAQPKIAEEIGELASDALIDQSLISLESVVRTLSNRMQGGRFVVGDHGGYFAETLPYLKAHFGQTFLGITEHTRNGEQRIQEQLRISRLQLPFLSSAQSKLKEESDKEITYSIVDEIIARQNLEEPQTRVLIVGYGTMGKFAADRFKKHDYDFGITIIDINARKVDEALQNGFDVSTNLREALPHSDIVILATDAIKGMAPVLSVQDIKSMKRRAVLTSMTSIDDEIDLESLITSGLLKAREIELLNKGCSLNTILPNGGCNNSICLVEAAELANAFVIAASKLSGSNMPEVLSQEDVDIIQAAYNRHFS